MVDVSRMLRGEPYVGVGRGGRKVIYNYRSKRFGIVDMVVELVEPEPMREALLFLAARG